MWKVSLECLFLLIEHSYILALQHMHPREELSADVLSPHEFIRACSFSPGPLIHKIIYHGFFFKFPL